MYKYCYSHIGAIYANLPMTSGTRRDITSGTSVTIFTLSSKREPRPSLFFILYCDVRKRLKRWNRTIKSILFGFLLQFSPFVPYRAMFSDDLVYFFPH